MFIFRIKISHYDSLFGNVKSCYLDSNINCIGAHSELLSSCSETRNEFTGFYNTVFLLRHVTGRTGTCSRSVCGRLGRPSDRAYQMVLFSVQNSEKRLTLSNLYLEGGINSLWKNGDYVSIFPKQLENHRKPYENSLTLVTA
jgi:hypothetical protein